jgi:2-polyprenyl-3-methyl-5-hydroxy-6-metoxy-1,4-benzoquinol methylase
MNEPNLFQELELIHARPAPFEFYTAEILWTNEHTANQMLRYHLNESIEAASRNSKFIDRSVEWISSHFNVAQHPEIADFGCGPGLYTTRLAERGARVTGIDFSENSLDYAGKTATDKKLKINYVLKNYLEFETSDRYDLILMIFCDFCVLGPEQRKKMLSKFRSFLKPGGAVLLDVYSLNRFMRIRESATCEFNQLNGFWSPEEYYGFVNVFKYEKEKVILDKYTIIEKTQKKVIYNWLQHYSPESLKIEFEKNGLFIEDVFSDVAGNMFDPGTDEFAIVARGIR